MAAGRKYGNADILLQSCVGRQGEHVPETITNMRSVGRADRLWRRDRRTIGWWYLRRRDATPLELPGNPSMFVPGGL